MFRKIVSQLSFSPALVGQLSFYARRLRKEQVTRRLGLIFVALAMVVQSLAVFQAPEPANAASPNDYVYGGLGLVSNGTYNFGIFMSAYDRNVNNLKDIMNYMGITRGELEAAGMRVNSNPRSGANLVKITNGNLLSWGMQPRFSAAQGERAVKITNGAGQHVTNTYARPLRLQSDIGSGYWALQGNSKKVGTFYILQGCGNLVTSFVPSPPPKPAPAPKPTPPAPKPVPPAKIIQTKAVKNLSRSKGMAQPGDKLRFTLTAQNTGGKNGSAAFKDDIKSALKYATLSDRGGASYDTASQTLTWANATVAPGKSVSRSFTVTVKPSNQLPNTAEDPTCRITNIYGNSKVTVDIRCPGPQPPKFTDLKTAKNITRNKPASDVMARAGDKITFTLSTKNTGEVTGKKTFQDKLTSIMQYATLTNAGGGTYNKTTQTLTWANVSIGPGKTVTRSFTVTLNKTLPISADPCSMSNSYGTTIGIGVNCQTPPAEIKQSKKATNLTQGNVDATTVTAKTNDRISFTITVSNSGGTAKTVQLSDSLTDTLEYATLLDRGGGIFNEDTKTLSWPDVTLQPGTSTTRTFAVQILPAIPATPQGVSDFTSYDCKIVNTFGNSVTIPVDCAGPKVVEQVVTELPTTGPGENITFSIILLAVVTYFFFRSKQLGREVRLIRRDLHAGTL